MTGATSGISVSQSGPYLWLHVTVWGRVDCLAGWIPCLFDGIRQALLAVCVWGAWPAYTVDEWWGIPRLIARPTALAGLTGYPLSGGSLCLLSCPAVSLYIQPAALQARTAQTEGSAS